MQTPEPVDVSFSPLLHRQQRHTGAARRRSLVANKQRVTPSGAVDGATRRAGTIFLLRRVASHLCSTTTLHSLRLAQQKKRLQQ